MNTSPDQHYASRRSASLRSPAARLIARSQMHSNQPSQSHLRAQFHESKTHIGVLTPPAFESPSEEFKSLQSRATRTNDYLINNFLTSSGEGDLSRNYTRSNEEHITTTQQRAPMSYSSTDSKAQLMYSNQYQSSPLSLSDQTAAMASQEHHTHRMSQNRGSYSGNPSNQSTANKQNDSKIKVQDMQQEAQMLQIKPTVNPYRRVPHGTLEEETINESSGVISHNDSSIVIQNRIDSHLKQINDKYFGARHIAQPSIGSSFKPQPNQMMQDTSNFSFNEEEKPAQELEPRVQLNVRENTITIPNTTHKIQRKEMNIDEPASPSSNNSIIEMEQKIEKEKRKVHANLDQKFNLVPNETAQKQHSISMFASSQSFEKLRDEILHPTGRSVRYQGQVEVPSNQPSFVSGSAELVSSSAGRINQSKLLNDSISPVRAINVQDGRYAEYQPLRSITQEHTGTHSNSVSPQTTSANTTALHHHARAPSYNPGNYKEYVNKLRDDHMQFENKLHALKSRISTINQSSLSDVYASIEPAPPFKEPPQIVTNPMMQQMAGLSSTPTVRDLTPGRKDLVTNIQILPIQEDGHQPSYTDREYTKPLVNVQGRQFETMNTNLVVDEHSLSFRSKMQDLKRTITDDEGSASKHNANPIPLQKPRIPKSSSSQVSLRLKKPASKASSKKDHNSSTEDTTKLHNISKQVRHLESRNRSQNQRIRDVINEKRLADHKVRDLEKRLEEMETRLVYEKHHNMSDQRDGQSRVKELETYIYDLQAVIQNKQQREKENLSPPAPVAINSMNLDMPRKPDYPPMGKIPLRQRKAKSPLKSLSAERNRSRARSLEKKEPLVKLKPRTRSQSVQPKKTPGKSEKMKQAHGKMQKMAKQMQKQMGVAQKQMQQQTKVISQLTDEVTAMRQKFDQVQQEKNEWQTKATSLSTHYFEALRELKDSLTTMRDDFETEKQEIIDGFSGQMQEILNKDAIYEEVYLLRQQNMELKQKLEQQQSVQAPISFDQPFSEEGGDHPETSP